MSFKSIALVVFLCVSPATADEPRIQPGAAAAAPAAVAPLTKGQPAPFSGVLLPTSVAQSLQAQINAVPDRIKVEVDNANRIADAQCTYKLNDAAIKSQTDSKICSLQLQERMNQLTFLERHLAKAERARPNTVLWSLLGAGVGSAVTVLLTFAVSSVAR